MASRGSLRGSFGSILVFISFFFFVSFLFLFSISFSPVRARTTNRARRQKSSFGGVARGKEGRRAKEERARKEKTN